MSLRKFIGGVSALAVALSAFAAMAVTASAATEYKDIAITPGTLYRVADNGNGTFKTANNSSSGYSGVIADLSGQTDIADATSVTVEFDTHVIASGGKTPILMYGVGDKTTRGLTAKGSAAGSYKTEGLITYFGSMNGTAYNVYGKTTNYASSVANKDVHAKVTLDRVTDTYKCVLTVGSNTVETSGDTTVDNLTVIEAITWGAAAYDITFKNIKVTYTVPLKVEKSVEASEAFTKAGGYDNDMVVGKLTVTVKNGSYDLKNAKYNQNTGIVTDADGNTIDATTITGDADGANALVFVVLNDVDDVAELNNVVFE